MVILPHIKIADIIHSILNCTSLISINLRLCRSPSIAMLPPVCSWNNYQSFMVSFRHWTVCFSVDLFRRYCVRKHTGRIYLWPFNLYGFIAIKKRIKSFHLSVTVNFLEVTHLELQTWAQIRYLLKNLGRLEEYFIKASFFLVISDPGDYTMYG